MPLSNSREPGPGGIATISGVEKISLHNSRRPTHGGITITCGVQKIPLANSTIPTDGSVAIISSAEEIPLSNSKKTKLCQYNNLICKEKISIPDSISHDGGFIMSTGEQRKSKILICNF
jgi:hypothetical protein